MAVIPVVVDLQKVRCHRRLIFQKCPRKMESPVLVASVCSDSERKHGHLRCRCLLGRFTVAPGRGARFVDRCAIDLTRTLLRKSVRTKCALAFVRRRLDCGTGRLVAPLLFGLPLEQDVAPCNKQTRWLWLGGIIRQLVLGLNVLNGDPVVVHMLPKMVQSHIGA
jgi:hypothetical protein